MKRLNKKEEEEEEEEEGILDRRSSTEEKKEPTSIYLKGVLHLISGEEAIIVLVDLEEEVDGPEVLLHEEQDAHGVDVEDVRGVHLRLLPSVERPGLVEAYEEHSLGLYLLQHFHEVLVHHDALDVRNQANSWVKTR